MMEELFDSCSSILLLSASAASFDVVLVVIVVILWTDWRFIVIITLNI